MRNMPAACPKIPADAQERVTAWGLRLRAVRMQLKLSARQTSEAAGISRITLHRIERGNPSVTVGAYAAVASVLEAERAAHDSEGTPMDRGGVVAVSRFPQLRSLAWNLAEGAELTADEALNLYERNWRHLDHESLSPEESSFIDHLVRTVGKGTLLV